MKLVASIWSLYREECVGGEKSQQCRISHMGYCKWLDGGECGRLDGGECGRLDGGECCRQCSCRPIGSPETSVRNYHYSLRNNTEERSSQLPRSGCLKSRTKRYMFRHIRIIIRRKHVRAVGLIRVFNNLAPKKNIFLAIFLYYSFNIFM